MRSLALALAFLCGVEALSLRSHDVRLQAQDSSKSIAAVFDAPAVDATVHRGIVTPALVDVEALLKPFVLDDSFKQPYLKTWVNGEQTWRYDAEPDTVAEALATLRKDELSYVLQFERLESVQQWPDALRAALPPALAAELAVGLFESGGGVTLHAYVTAPNAFALPEHEDLGDVLVLQVSGTKIWSLGGETVALAPGDGLWLPRGTSHSAVAGPELSVHLTIHRASEAHVQAETERLAAEKAAEMQRRRFLNHVTGDDGTDGDYEFENDRCSIWDASCPGQDEEVGCPCNVCRWCNDAGAYCMFEATDVALVDPCCDTGDDDSCKDAKNWNEAADAEGWVPVEKPDKDCSWIAQDPDARCNMKGVIINNEFHYGVEWLINNNRRFKAKEACPVACGTLCGDSTSWTYIAGHKGEKGCGHVSKAPEDRCGRVGVDGIKAEDACMASCDNCGGLPLVTPRPTGRPSYMPTKSYVPGETKFDDYDIWDATRLWVNDKEAAIAKYGRISGWDVSEVTKMDGLFSLYTPWRIYRSHGYDWEPKMKKFNEDLSAWNVGKVTHFEGMFHEAKKFNSDISEWDTSKAEKMDEMFRDAKKFNQPIGSWDISNVDDADDMFSDAKKFNQDLSDWDVEKICDEDRWALGYMFSGTKCEDTNCGLPAECHDADFAARSPEPAAASKFPTLLFVVSGLAVTAAAAHLASKTKPKARSAAADDAAPLLRKS